MFKLLLAVMLVPADNSVDQTSAQDRPAAIGRTIPVRDLVSLGMTTDEVVRLLGEPSGGRGFVNDRGGFEGFIDYRKLGISVLYSGSRTLPPTVHRIIKYAPRK